MGVIISGNGCWFYGGVILTMTHDPISFLEWIVIGSNLVICILIVLFTTGTVKVREKTLIGIMFIIIGLIIIAFLLLFVYIGDIVGFK